MQPTLTEIIEIIRKKSSGKSPENDNEKAIRSCYKQTELQEPYYFQLQSDIIVSQKEGGADKSSPLGKGLSFEDGFSKFKKNAKQILYSSMVVHKDPVVLKEFAKDYGIMDSTNIPKGYNCLLSPCDAKPTCSDFPSYYVIWGLANERITTCPTGQKSTICCPGNGYLHPWEPYKMKHFNKEDRIVKPEAGFKILWKAIEAYHSYEGKQFEKFQFEATSKSGRSMYDEDYEDNLKHFCEDNMNQLPFRKEINKLIFKHIMAFGENESFYCYYSAADLRLAIWYARKAFGRNDIGIRQFS